MYVWYVVQFYILYLFMYAVCTCEVRGGTYIHALHVVHTHVRMCGHTSLARWRQVECILFISSRNTFFFILWTFPLRTIAFVAKNTPIIFQRFRPRQYIWTIQQL